MAVACNVFVSDDTFQFGYLMSVRSALLLMEEVVLVQCDLGCSMVGELKTPVVAAGAETVPAAEFEVEAEAALVDKHTSRWWHDSNSEDGYADTARVWYSGDSVRMERCFGGSVGTELVNYFDAVTDKVPAIHSFDKVLLHCMDDTVVPDNWHNCYAPEADLVHNSSHDYDWPQAVGWVECDIALVAEKMKLKLKLSWNWFNGLNNIEIERLKYLMVVGCLLLHLLHLLHFLLFL